jgi:aldose 1-epimerase
MSIERSNFGTTPDGKQVELFTLKSAKGLVAKISTFGAAITELHVPDRKGKLANVVLGFENLEQYLTKHPFFGVTVGRVANRIARGDVVIDGKSYQVDQNEKSNTLHGGARGFDKVVWDARAGSNSVTMSHTSPDGDMGFPGALATTVTFTLADDASDLRIDYEAKPSGKPTVVNLTNHSYFNLTGAGRGDILGHELTLSADKYLPVDAQLIPTGQLADVRGGPMDFTKAMTVGSRIAQVPGGYDHCYALHSAGGKLAQAAELRDPASGRTMEVHTTQPGVQLYTGNFLDGTVAGLGGTYGKHAALCLETQHFPDAVHHPDFPSIVVRPGQTYRQTTVFRFGVR